MHNSKTTPPATVDILIIEVHEVLLMPAAITLDNGY